MDELITAIPTAISAFTATNLDDLLLLSLWFSQINNTFRVRHVFIGQFLGFSILVIASIPGFFGGLILPDRWIGLLGLAPIAIGDDSKEVNEVQQPETSPFASVLSPQIYSVAAITVANGSDNVSIYVPLFANSNLIQLLIIISIFFLLVGVWCYASYKLVSQSSIGDVLNRYGSNLVPFVLIGLGVFIILESDAMHPLALLASCFCLMVIVKKYKPTIEVKEN
jgi:cadmium resistance transport/sequestration family protein